MSNNDKDAGVVEVGLRDEVCGGINCKDVPGTGFYIDEDGNLHINGGGPAVYAHGSWRHARVLSASETKEN